MKTLTSIQELARRFLVEEVTGVSPGLAPFALQRFMQGRRLIVSSDSRSASKLEVSVQKWAFAWLDSHSRNGFGPDSLIPGLFTLPTSAQASSAVPIPFCHGCWGSLSPLIPHPQLFQEEQNRLGKIIPHPWPARRAHFVRKPDRTQDRFSSAPFTWNARIPNVKGHCGNLHKMVIIAELDMLLNSRQLDGPASESLEIVSAALYESVRMALCLFAGESSSELTNRVWIERSAPRRPMVVPPRQLFTDEKSRTEEEEERVRSHEADAVDRLLQRCASIARSEETFDPLTVLLVRRCGDDAINPAKAQGRFAFGNKQRERIRTVLLEKCEKEVPFAKEVLNKAVSLEDRITATLGSSGDEWHRRILEGLGQLQFKRADGRLAGSEPTDSYEVLVPPDSRVLAGCLESALGDPFPVDSVVSNRIMGSCLIETIRGLWGSPDLIQTLSGYPIATLLAEMIIFPPAVGETLIYFPLPVPHSRRRQDASSFFLSYAVAMCPSWETAKGSAMHIEDFREIVSVSNGDLYLSFLEGVLERMHVACLRLVESQQAIVDGSFEAGTMFKEAIKAGNMALFDLFRLADFHPPTDQIFLRSWTPPVWKDSLPHLFAGAGNNRPPLVHESLLRSHSDILEMLYEAAVLELKLRRLLESRRLKGIQHSGLLKPIQSAVGVVGRVRRRVKDASIAKTLGDLEQSLVLVQDRWTLFERRYHNGIRTDSRGRIVEQLQRLYAPNCSDLFAIAEATLADLCRKKDRPPPTVRPALRIANLGDHAVFEEDAALLEIFANLLSNLAIHEQSSTALSDGWGIELTWIDAEEIRKLSDLLANAYQHWIPGLRNGGAVLVRAFPTSFREDALRLWLQGFALAGHSEKQGLWSLATITQAYDECWQQKPELRLRDPLTPITSHRGYDKNGILVLVPGH